MVSTRGHPVEFPMPDLAPNRSTSTPSRAPEEKNSQTLRLSDKQVGVMKGKWVHTPSNLAIIWLFVSLPLVAWDTGYVMFRPLTMPGGSLHWPLYVPYELYGRVDYIYGWKAFNEHNGFTAAQGLLNIIESLLYGYYLYILFAYGRQTKAQGRRAPKPSTVGFLGQQRYVDGQMGALAVVVAYSAALMTVSKTALYWLNEYYSGFSNIGHNSFPDLLLLWIIPNGAWLVLPSYMIYLSGSEILQGLAIAGGGANTSSDDTSLVKTE